MMDDGDADEEIAMALQAASHRAFQARCAVCGELRSKRDWTPTQYRAQKCNVHGPEQVSHL